MARDEELQGMQYKFTTNTQVNNWKEKSFKFPLARMAYLHHIADKK